MNRIDFIALIAPIAIKLRLEGSSIFPSLRIAQVAHETDWRIHPWNNLGGFKVGSGVSNTYWKGATHTTPTWEVINGQRIETTAIWRAYDTIDDFFHDQDLLYAKPRYDRVRAARTPFDQAEMLYKCGYATDAPASVDGDPVYYEKLWNIIDMYGLIKYDKEADRVLEGLLKRIADLEAKASMPVPDWAKEAVTAAVKCGIVKEPDGGSLDFYRILTVLHRKGVF